MNFSKTQIFLLSANNVSAYLPIYFLYYVIMVFQVQLAQTALGIKNRFHRINIILRTILLNGTIQNPSNTRQ